MIIIPITVMSSFIRTNRNVELFAQLNTGGPELPSAITRRAPLRVTKKANSQVLTKDYDERLHCANLNHPDFKIGLSDNSKLDYLQGLSPVGVKQISLKLTCTVINIWNVLVDRCRCSLTFHVLHKHIKVTIMRSKET